MNTETLAFNLALRGKSGNQLRIENYPYRVSMILKLLAQLKHGALHLQLPEIGRASCRERVCLYV